MKSTPLNFITVMMALVAGSASGYTVIYDDFTDPAGSLNTQFWNPDGWATPYHAVANGKLTMRSMGHSHYASISSNNTSINFFEKPHTITVELDGFLEPIWSTQLDANRERELFFGILKLNSLEDDHPDWYTIANWIIDGFGGFQFSLRWDVVVAQQPGTLKLYSRNPATGIPDMPISNVPTAVTFSLDGPDWTITMAGATFINGGGNSISGTHTLTEADYQVGTGGHYYSTVLALRQSMSATNEARIKSVQVTADVDPWAAYPRVDGWIDTGAWMGFLYVDRSPWVYSSTYGRWLYVVEDHIFPEGAWFLAN